MSHILVQTEDRLVVRLSSTLSLTSALFTLDRSTRRIHIEKTSFLTPAEPLDIAFSDISSIEDGAYPEENVTDHAIHFELQSGGQRLIRGGDETTTADAAARMQDFLHM